MPKKTIILILIFLTGIVLAQPVLAIRFTDPLGTSTFDQMLERVLSWIWPLSGAIAVLMILIGAYFMILSAGEPQRVATGRRIIIFALVGFAIITISRGIVDIVQIIVGPGTEPLQILPRVINYVFGFLLATAVLMIIFAAYMFIIFGGNPEKVRRARNWLIYALIGLAVGIASRGLIGWVAKMLGLDFSI